MPLPLGAAIITGATTLLAALVVTLLKEGILPTLNKRVSLHVELLKHDQSGDLKDLLQDEIAALVARDRRYLDRPVVFYVIQALLHLSVGAAATLLITTSVGLYDAIRSVKPYKPGGLEFRLPAVLVTCCAVLALFLLRRRKLPVSPPAPGTE